MQTARSFQAKSRLGHAIARWPALREEFPLPAERGEGQGEGCLGNTRTVSTNVFKAFPSPRPSPRSFLTGRGRRGSAVCSPWFCLLSCGLPSTFGPPIVRFARRASHHSGPAQLGSRGGE